MALEDDIPDQQTGEIIYARWLNQAKDTALHGDATPAGAQEWRMPFGNQSEQPDIPQLLFVRIIYDVVPNNWNEALGPDEDDASSGNFNAVVQVWTDEQGDYEDDPANGLMVVAPYNAPLRKNSLCWVLWDDTASAYVPVRQEESFAVFPISGVTNSNGLYSGVIMTYDPNGLTPTQGDNCWIQELNSNPLGPIWYTARLTGHWNGLPIMTICAGGLPTKQGSGSGVIPGAMDVQLDNGTIDVPNVNRIVLQTPGLTLRQQAPGVALIGRSDISCPIIYQSNSCPIFTTFAFGGTIGTVALPTGLRVEYTLFDLVTCQPLDVWCLDNPNICCGGSGSGSGSGSLPPIIVPCCPAGVPITLYATFFPPCSQYTLYSTVPNPVPLTFNALRGLWVYSFGRLRGTEEFTLGCVRNVDTGLYNWVWTSPFTGAVKGAITCCTPLCVAFNNTSTYLLEGGGVVPSLVVVSATNDGACPCSIQTAGCVAAIPAELCLTISGTSGKIDGSYPLYYALNADNFSPALLPGWVAGIMCGVTAPEIATMYYDPGAASWMFTSGGGVPVAFTPSACSPFAATGTNTLNGISYSWAIGVVGAGCAQTDFAYSSRDGGATGLVTPDSVEIIFSGPGCLGGVSINMGGGFNGWNGQLDVICAGTIETIYAQLAYTNMGGVTRWVLTVNVTNVVDPVTIVSPSPFNATGSITIDGVPYTFCVQPGVCGGSGSGPCGSGSGTGSGSGSMSGSGSGNCCGFTGGTPGTLHLTLTNVSGLACLAGTYAILWNHFNNAWVLGPVVCGGNILDLTVICNSLTGNFELSGSCGGSFFNGTSFGNPGTATCLPVLTVVGNAPIVLSSPCGNGSFTWTLME